MYAAASRLWASGSSRSAATRDWWKRTIWSVVRSCAETTVAVRSARAAPARISLAGPPTRACFDIATCGSLLRRGPPRARLAGGRVRGPDEREGRPEGPGVPAVAHVRGEGVGGDGVRPLGDRQR